METIDVRTDIERDPWGPDVAAKLAGHGKITSVGVLRHGTEEGRATIALLIELDDGAGYVFAETTYRLARVAALAVAASPAVAEEVLDD